MTILAEITFGFRPNPIIAGETASLVITSSEGKAKIKKLPAIKGLEWVKDSNISTSIKIINGRKYEDTIYPFIVEKPQDISIPSLEIELNGKSLSTQKCKISIHNGPLSDIEKKLFIKADYLLGEPKKNAFIGEDIPLLITLYKLQSLKADPSAYPDVKLGDVVFDDYSSYNKASKRFAPYPYNQEDTRIDGNLYRKSSFLTSFRPTSIGELNGTVSLNCEILISDNSNKKSNSLFGGSFFDSSFFSRGDSNKIISKTLAIKLPPLEIIPLPSPPKDTFYLNIIGRWKISINLSPPEMKVGEASTLSLKISGKGSLEPLTAPELSIPGFTVYHPEIIESTTSIKVAGQQDEATVNYVLIPQKKGKSDIKLSFSSFSPENGQYIVEKFDKKTVILPGTNLSNKTYSSSSTFAEEKTGNFQIKKIQKQSIILYIAHF